MKLRSLLGNWSRNLLSSERTWVQVIGAFLHHLIPTALLLLMLTALVIGLCMAKEDGRCAKEECPSGVSKTKADTLGKNHSYTVILVNNNSTKDSLEACQGCGSGKVQGDGAKATKYERFVTSSLYLFVLLTLFVVLCICVCYRLAKVFSLRKEEPKITRSQIFILLFIGMWIVGVVLIFDLKNQPRLATAIGVLGSILTWIFQDTIKGVVAFFHLRLNNLLRIDDWIKVPEHNVDGEVKSVTLTTVTLSNWDTTTSSVPTSMLHSGHFVNLKSMMDGKTHGRRMYMSFIMDTGWFHIIDDKEAAKIWESGDVKEYLSEDQVKKDVTNAQLFRLYLYHWLMNHPHISQQPRLIVRWLEQKESGMPLQVYAFIIDSSLPSFEWQQSLIMEHVIKSMQWFGLRLYQSPSNYDVSNSNVFLTDKPASYRNKE